MQNNQILIFFFVLKEKAWSKATSDSQNKTWTYTEGVLAYIVNIQRQNMIFAPHVDPILIFIHQ